ncbi:hypothetical protein HK100_005343 [Physocladia obscura]|uniref:GRAM domain-containing protein n=1 Tax=Physocladia obscura TaxID=109957 RepID=A0AAD5X861_9FUNG|nr:hypothetical protein HK100_005343 [Physocladia obscura]
MNQTIAHKANSKQTTVKARLSAILQPKDAKEGSKTTSFFGTDSCVELLPASSRFSADSFERKTISLPRIKRRSSGARSQNEVYNCALLANHMLYQGKLTLVEDSNMLLFKSLLHNEVAIRITSSTDIQKTKLLGVNTSLIIKNGSSEYFFASFLSRDSCYDTIHQMINRLKISDWKKRSLDSDYPVTLSQTSSSSTLSVNNASLPLPPPSSSTDDTNDPYSSPDESWKARLTHLETKLLKSKLSRRHTAGVLSQSSPAIDVTGASKSLYSPILTNATRDFPIAAPSATSKQKFSQKNITQKKSELIPANSIAVNKLQENVSDPCSRFMSFAKVIGCLHEGKIQYKLMFLMIFLFVAVNLAMILVKMDHQLDNHMLSRLLYANPVCLLTTSSIILRRRNVMTISWLTAIDNHGHFICSMNANRTSATILKAQNQHNTAVGSAENASTVGALFVLNVPTSDTTQLVASIGSTSGRSYYDGENASSDSVMDKFIDFAVAICLPGWYPPPENTFPWSSAKNASIIAENFSSDTSAVDPVTGKKRQRRRNPNLSDQHAKQGLIGISDCIAHIVCRIEEQMERHGHLILFCVIEAGFVKRGYWNGKNFSAQEAVGDDSKALPPYVSFLGSKVFATVDVIKNGTQSQE